MGDGAKEVEGKGVFWSVYASLYRRSASRPCAWCCSKSWLGYTVSDCVAGRGRFVGWVAFWQAFPKRCNNPTHNLPQPIGYTNTRAYDWKHIGRIVRCRTLLGSSVCCVYAAQVDYAFRALQKIHKHRCYRYGRVGGLATDKPVVTIAS